MKKIDKEYIKNKISSDKHLIMLTLALITKIGYFYFSTQMPLAKIHYSFVTLSFFVLLFLFLHKRPKMYFPVILLFTILLYGDVLYFRYFSGFLSAGMIHQTAFAGSVTEIILSLVRITDILLFLDLAAYIFFIKNEGKARFNFRKLTVSAVSVVLIGISLGTSSMGYHTGIRRYEFVNYHLFDLFNLDSENSVLESSEKREIIDLMIQRYYDSDKGNYYGVAEGRNVFLLQMESIQSNVLNVEYNGQEITPNLNQLSKNDGFNFNNYYQMLGRGSTADAEFVSLNSLYPITTGDSYTVYERNSFYGLPWILREYGYSATSYHGYVASFWNRENIYPQIGFQKSYFEDDYLLGETIGFGLVGFGLDDHDFFNQSMDYIKGKSGKSFNFMISLSCHKPYTLPEDYMWIDLDEEDENIFGNYLNAAHYFDHALGEFIDDLKENDLYDNSIIILYGDHYGIGIEDREATERIERFLGREYTYEDMFKIPLIVHIPGMGENIQIDITGGQIDLLPTMLNLLGIKNRYLTFGRDLLNSDEGFVASQTFMDPGSFIDNEIVYVASRSGDFEDGFAFHRDTHEPVEIEGLDAKFNDALKWISYSKKITHSDVLIEIIDEFEDKMSFYKYKIN